MGNGNGNGYTAAVILGILIVFSIFVGLATVGMLGFLVHQENNDKCPDCNCTPIKNGPVSANAMADALSLIQYGENNVISNMDTLTQNTVDFCKAQLCLGPPTQGSCTPNTCYRNNGCCLMGCVEPSQPGCGTSNSTSCPLGCSSTRTQGP